MTPSRWIAAFAAVLAAGMVTDLSLAAVLHVPGDYSTIQAAIDAAATGDSVLVAPGTYAGAGNKNLDFAGKDIALVSEAGPQVTVIDCQSDGRALHLHSGESAAVIKGFTMRNGDVTNAGAVLLDGVSATIADCVFESNSAIRGGAIAGFAGTNMVVSNCSFAGNGAYYGGGLYVGSSTANVSQSLFRSNGSFLGGGAAAGESSPAVSSSLTFDRCVFLENSASLKVGAGGAIICLEDDLVMESTHARPVRGQGTLHLSRCTLVRNHRTAIISHFDLTVENCTFHGNSGHNQPPGPNAIWAGGSVRIENSILANGLDGAPVGGGFQVLAFCTDVFGNPGGDWVGPLASQLGINGNVALDPRFCDPANDNFTLSEDSPCAPAHSGGCGLIGAHDVACGATAVEPATWGRVKAIFQRRPQADVKGER